MGTPHGLPGTPSVKARIAALHSAGLRDETAEDRIKVNVRARSSGREPKDVAAWCFDSKQQVERNGERRFQLDGERGEAEALAAQCDALSAKVETLEQQLTAATTENATMQREAAAGLLTLTPVGGSETALEQQATRIATLEAALFSAAAERDRLQAATAAATPSLTASKTTTVEVMSSGLPIDGERVRMVLDRLAPSRPSRRRSLEEAAEANGKRRRVDRRSAPVDASVVLDVARSIATQSGGGDERALREALAVQRQRHAAAKAASEEAHAAELARVRQALETAQVGEERTRRLQASAHESELRNVNYQLDEMRRTVDYLEEQLTSAKSQAQEEATAAENDDETARQLLQVARAEAAAAWRQTKAAEEEALAARDEAARAADDAGKALAAAHAEAMTAADYAMRVAEEAAAAVAQARAEAAAATAALEAMCRSVQREETEMKRELPPCEPAAVMEHACEAAGTTSGVDAPLTQPFTQEQQSSFGTVAGTMQPSLVADSGAEYEQLCTLSSQSVDSVEQVCEQRQDCRPVEDEAPMEGMEHASEVDVATADEAMEVDAATAEEAMEVVQATPEPTTTQQQQQQQWRQSTSNFDLTSPPHALPSVWVASEVLITQQLTDRRCEAEEQQVASPPASLGHQPTRRRRSSAVAQVVPLKTPTGRARAGAWGVEEFAALATNAVRFDEDWEAVASWVMHQGPEGSALYPRVAALKNAPASLKTKWAKSVAAKRKKGQVDCGVCGTADFPDLVLTSCSSRRCKMAAVHTFCTDLGTTKPRPGSWTCWDCKQVGQGLLAAINGRAPAAAAVSAPPPPPPPACRMCGEQGQARHEHPQFPKHKLCEGCYETLEPHSWHDTKKWRNKRKPECDAFCRYCAGLWWQTMGKIESVEGEEVVDCDTPGCGHRFCLRCIEHFFPTDMQPGSTTHAALVHCKGDWSCFVCRPSAAQQAEEAEEASTWEVKAVEPKQRTPASSYVEDTIEDADEPTVTAPAASPSPPLPELAAEGAECDPSAGSMECMPVVEQKDDHGDDDKENTPPSNAGLAQSPGNEVLESSFGMARRPGATQLATLGVTACAAVEGVPAPKVAKKKKKKMLASTQCIVPADLM